MSADDDCGSVTTIGELHLFMKSMQKNLTEELRRGLKEISTSVNNNVAAIRNLEGEVAKINNTLNDREQRDRNYSIRVFNLEVPPSGEHGPTHMDVINHVYTELVAPVLGSLADKGLIPDVPPALQLFEYGHILPAPKKAATNIPPIIIRFFSRSYKTLFMKNKREFLAGVNKTSRLKISVFEDLTAHNFKRLKALNEEDPRVEKAFSINGQIKYILSDDLSKKIRTLKSVTAEIEST